MLLFNNQGCPTNGILFISMKTKKYNKVKLNCADIKRCGVNKEIIREETAEEDAYISERQLSKNSASAQKEKEQSQILKASEEDIKDSARFISEVGRNTGNFNFGE